MDRESLYRRLSVWKGKNFHLQTFKSYLKFKLWSDTKSIWHRKLPFFSLIPLHNFHFMMIKSKKLLNLFVYLHSKSSSTMVEIYFLPIFKMKYFCSLFNDFSFLFVAPNPVKFSQFSSSLRRIIWCVSKLNTNISTSSLFYFSWWWKLPWLMHLKLCVESLSRAQHISESRECFLHKYLWNTWVKLCRKGSKVSRKTL